MDIVKNTQHLGLLAAMALISQKRNKRIKPSTQHKQLLIKANKIKIRIFERTLKQ